MRWCSVISEPGSRYLRVCRNEKPPCNYGLNAALRHCAEDCRKSWQLVAVRTQIRCICVNAYKSWSRRWIRVVKVIVNVLIKRILDNILRSSSVFWMLTVDCGLSLFLSLPGQCHLFIVVIEVVYAYTSTLWLQSSWERYLGHVMNQVMCPVKTCHASL